MTTAKHPSCTRTPDHTVPSVNSATYSQTYHDGDAAPTPPTSEDASKNNPGGLRERPGHPDYHPSLPL